MSLENYRYMFGGPVELDQPLQDIVIDEFSGAVFKCKIRGSSEESLTCEWYKDGKNIVPSSKFIISCNGKWHRLNITTTTVHDQGVYVVIIKHRFGEVFSKGNLYVNQIKKNHFNTDFLCLHPMDRNLEVVHHLRFTKILVGQTIELEARFNYNVSDIIWYKSNHLLVRNERMILLNDGKLTTLSILRATETDSGIYHVISKSEYGIASSFASVIVINTDLNTLYTCENLPSIREYLPEELEVNEGEDVRLTCRATYDVNTMVHWTKNGSLLSDNNNLSIRFHNNKYISLRIRNVCYDDNGEYCLTMWDKITGQADSSTCFLSINDIAMENQCSFQVKKPLEPTVTCFGARIAFNCSFAIDDPIFYYVVWHIGHFRVERTNHKFHMMQSGGEFYIVIKQVEPGMADKVVCELRRALPNKKSLFTASTSTTLTIVPPSMIDNESNFSTTITRRNIFYNINLKLEIPVRQRNLKKKGTHRCTVSSNGDKNTGEKNMIITYCRLDDDNYYLSLLNNDDDLIVERVSVYEKPARGQSSTEPSNIVVIEWYDTVPAGVTGKRWYCIDLAYTNDDFVEAGVSSFPMFEITNPPIEQIMKFRIKAAYPLFFTYESRVCILPAVREEKISNRICSLRPMEEFAAKFTKTGETIGCGAFGSVVLIHDENGVYYAAKILKTRTQKKRNYAVREYETMKNLQHPKLVKLYDAFTSRDSFILVMDYLWGGELFDRIVEEECVKEVDVVFYVRQICEALVYLHERNIVHLDLKPENIICLSPNSRQVKIIDFGLARVLEANNVTRAIYGTRDYVAPEVLNFEAITLECDMWSLGVLTYMLLSGLMPFSGTNWAERSAKITLANYNYDEAVFQGISDLAKDFVDQLLVLKPAQRMKSFEALHHQWIVEGPPDGDAGHMKKAQENLKSYLANNKARWQRIANVMIAAHRLRTNVEGQRNDEAPDAGWSST